MTADGQISYIARWLAGIVSQAIIHYLGIKGSTNHHVYICDQLSSKQFTEIIIDVYQIILLAWLVN